MAARQILALAGALGGESAVAADDEPLARELGRGDAGHIAVIKQRHLQCVAVEQRLDRRGEGGNPVEPGRFDVLGDPRLGDHAAVTDQDDMVESEALLNTLVTAIAPEHPFTLIARPTPVQQRARDLLGLSRTQ